MYLVRNKKSPYYQIIYYKNGKRTSVSTGTSNKKTAEKFLLSFKQHPPRIPKKKKYSVTLSTFISEYKCYVRDTYSENYLKKAVNTSFNRFQVYIPDIPIDKISTRQVDQFISSVYAKSKYASLLYYKTLKSAFNKAVIWEYIKENPFAKIKSPKVPTSFPVYLSEAELILILNKTKDQLLKDIFTTAFYTGMRLNEILNIKWNWIDFQQSILTVKNSEDFKTKSKRERIIPIHPKINRILSGLNIKSKFVFYKIPGVKLNEDYVSKKFKKAVRASGLDEKIHFHTLRHSFASALVKQGVSLYIVKELLGHSKITTTQIYSHIDNGSLSKAIKKLAS